MQNNLGWLFIVLFLGLVSCDSQRVFDTYKSVPNAWQKDSIVTFDFKAPDSINPYNLFVNIRNSNDYQFSNLYLIVEMQFPNGKRVKDTLEYEMTRSNGEFIGTGFSDIKENKLWYKEAVIFFMNPTFFTPSLIVETML